MLTELDLTTFKCFSRLTLPLAPLTILSGRNSSGKSSILQSILLLHQTAVESEWSEELRLNGRMMALGTARDVVDKVHGHLDFSIGLSTREATARWTFRSEDRAALSAKIRQLDVGPRGAPPEVSMGSDEPKRYLLPHGPGAPPGSASLAEALQSIQYVSAERMGPRETYPLLEPTVRAVGARGENVPSILYWLGDEAAAPRLLTDRAPPTLRRQLESRMGDFFPGCGLDVQLVPMANQLTLALRMDSATSFHRPQHVGFGLTQTLPILMAPLVAREGETILLENPEIHLHPSGQSQIGRFLAEVASKGTQVLVETHSDHVLNGIRRAVRDGLLPPDQLAIHFLSRTEGQSAPALLTPRIDRRGRIEQWPDGFFDQLDRDLMELADWGEDG